VQIEIDFEIFKTLTLMRRDESDSYGDVIRRLLYRVDTESLLEESGSGTSFNALLPTNTNAFAQFAQSVSAQPNALAAIAGGAWFDNTHFPEGTQFRGTYKGKTYRAEIKNGAWVGCDGIKRTSPSAAACAISDTSVNGWKFWLVKRPGDKDWQRMDAVRR
jgi:hypothetical protein